MSREEWEIGIQEGRQASGEMARSAETFRAAERRYYFLLSSFLVVAFFVFMGIFIVFSTGSWWCLLVSTVCLATLSRFLRVARASRDEAFEGLHVSLSHAALSMESLQQELKRTWEEEEKVPPAT